jgi:hypothetical protein
MSRVPCGIGNREDGIDTPSFYHSVCHPMGRRSRYFGRSVLPRDQAFKTALAAASGLSSHVKCPDCRPLEMYSTANAWDLNRATSNPWWQDALTYLRGQPVSDRLKFMKSFLNVGTLKDRRSSKSHASGDACRKPGYVDRTAQFILPLG